MKKKLETKSTGPLRDEDAPWNGITLNRCLVVAAIAALLSMGFQVLQDAVDSDDDITEIEAEALTPFYQNEQLAEPWFFESWFGSSKAELPAAGEPESLHIEKPKPQAELATPSVEQPVSTIEKKAKVKEIQADSLIQKPLVSEKLKNKKAIQKPSEQWGLKAKDKYIAVKAAKIRRQPTEGSKKREVFPFTKKVKELIKSYPEVKEKSKKEKSYQKKHGERKFDHQKKQEFGKSFKKETGEQTKYYRQEKGHREDMKKKNGKRQ